MMVRKSVPFFIAWFLMPGAATAATFVPYGPQENVSAATVAGWGWTECYSALYATPLGNDATAALAGCTGDLLMLAGRRTGSDTFLLLAAASREDVLFDTGANFNLTNPANGSNWYYRPSWSWGFAGLGDAVEKNSCDVFAPDETDRLCWHTYDSVGGWRLGSNRYLNDSTEFEKVILSAQSAAPIPEPATLLLLGAGLAATGVRQRLKKRG